MDGNPPTPKQIAQKYWGNLAYFRKSHYLRRLRTWCFATIALCSLVGAATFHYWGSGRVFSKGPISKNHATFANDCRACHLDAEIGALKALLSERPSGSSLRTLFGKDIKDDHQRAAWARMDEACLKCHATTALHLPQSAGLALQTVSANLPVVHATQCFSCHREHVGHNPMLPPSRDACASCHNDADALRRTRASLALKSTPVAAAGENRDLGDGLLRFLAPARTAAHLPPFADYAHGHPPFSYEQAGLRDPTELKFNHARHERADVTVLGPDQKLSCADCHKPGPGGAYYQPVSYQRHCQQCHSLQVLPDLPNLRIPHGDAQKVRYFLASIRVAIESAVRAGGATDPAELSKQVETELQSLRKRGPETLAELEQRVFFDGDPKDNPNDRRLRTGNRKFLTECAKCHAVTPGEPGKSPRINPPQMAERWVQHGPFTHLPHTHMDCADCHQGAHTSKLTSDILMPPQKLCAECHRPPSAASPVTATALKSPNPSKTGPELAAEQRRTGGIKWDCQSCHVFHASPDAGKLIQKWSARSPVR
jgi:hypothetical protein